MNQLAIQHNNWKKKYQNTLIQCKIRGNKNISYQIIIQWLDLSLFDAAYIRRYTARSTTVKLHCLLYAIRNCGIILVWKLWCNTTLKCKLIRWNIFKSKLSDIHNLFSNPTCRLAMMTTQCGRCWIFLYF